MRKGIFFPLEGDTVLMPKWYFQNWNFPCSPSGHLIKCFCYYRAVLSSDMTLREILLVNHRLGSHTMGTQSSHVTSNNAIKMWSLIVLRMIKTPVKYLLFQVYEIVL